MTKCMRLALTTGEPGGIGPDLTLMLASRIHWAADVIALGDPDVLRTRARLLNLNIRLRPYHAADNPRPCQQGELFFVPVHCPAPVTPGVLDRRNASYTIELLKRATQGCLQGDFDAMVTAPLHKGVINDAGIPFTGHTEFLAELTQAELPVMLLASDHLRVALATTHLPVNKISQALSTPLLCQVLQVLHGGLQQQFGLENPHILICGLNPHAGEGGHLGMEEIDTIIPAIQHMQQQGLNLTGPLPADTLFLPRMLKTADAVLAMYHDQGLPVLKHASFGRAVNVTLGLPIIRTSVDHGTALDLAGTGQAEPESLQAAIQMAFALIHKTQHLKYSSSSIR